MKDKLIDIEFKNLKIGEYFKGHKIIGKTSSSFELYHKKTSEKGVNCTQWYHKSKMNTIEKAI